MFMRMYQFWNCVVSVKALVITYDKPTARSLSGTDMSDKLDTLSSKRLRLVCYVAKK